MAEQEQTVDQQQEKAREKAEDDRYQRAEQQQAAYDDEYESRRETLSALALFQQDSVEQLAGGSRQNRRDYYQKLLSRLYIELRDLGASMLLDQLDAQLTQKHQGKCAMLVYSAVTQCYQMLVLDAPMADAANAVPDVFTAEREPMTWELLASYSADPELPVRASFTTRVRVLRSVSRLLYQARRDGRSAAPEEDALRARLQEYQLMAKMQDESLENAARNARLTVPHGVLGIFADDSPGYAGASEETGCMGNDLPVKYRALVGIIQRKSAAVKQGCNSRKVMVY